MLRLLVLSLTILHWTPGSLAETCGNCLSSCSGQEGDSQCCNWNNPPIETDLASLTQPNRSPLGFTTAFLPRVESDDPFPCVTFTIPEPSRQSYIQVAVQSNTDVCVYEDGNEDDKACQQVLFFCNPDGYTGENTVTFRFGCTSCPAAETPFFFRIEIETLDMVDEDWCDNSNRTLPRDLIQDENTAFTVPDISQPGTVTDSAPLFLVNLGLLIISVLIAILSL